MLAKLSNRHGTDPYAWWWGRGGVARRPPIPIEAAHVIMTRVAKWSALKSWAVRVAQRRGAKRGKVALARKLAVVLHRMWVSETDFRYAVAKEA